MTLLHVISHTVATAIQVLQIYTLPISHPQIKNHIVGIEHNIAPNALALPEVSKPNLLSDQYENFSDQVLIISVKNTQVGYYDQWEINEQITFQQFGKKITATFLAKARLKLGAHRHFDHNGGALASRNLLGVRICQIDEEDKPSRIGLVIVIRQNTLDLLGKKPVFFRFSLLH